MVPNWMWYWFNIIYKEPGEVVIITPILFATKVRNLLSLFLMYFWNSFLNSLSSLTETVAFGNQRRGIEIVFNRASLDLAIIKT